MSKAPDSVDLDRFLHEPARLLTLVQLAAVNKADFTWLLRQTGLTRGIHHIHNALMGSACVGADDDDGVFPFRPCIHHGLSDCDHLVVDERTLIDEYRAVAVNGHVDLLDKIFSQLGTRLWQREIDF